MKQSGWIVHISGGQSGLTTKIIVSDSEAEIILNMLMVLHSPDDHKLICDADRFNVNIDDIGEYEIDLESRSNPYISCSHLVCSDKDILEYLFQWRDKNVG